MTNHRQSGFSMIEVLITIVVIAFGFLSLLSLQMTTLNNLSTNNQRTIALMLAAGVGERLRSNVGSAGSYNNVSTDTFSADCSNPGACTLVNQDVWEFQQSIKNEPQLTNGVGTISINSVSNVATIGVAWTEKRGTRFTYTMQVPL